MTARATTERASNRALRLLLVTDAWAPQVNGVSRTYQWLAKKLCEHTQFHVLSPDGFPSFGLPTYPDIRLALSTPARIARRIEGVDPDVVHIATEGPLGWLARAWCKKTGLPFTTCYHTRFPEYVASRFPVPAGWIYPLFRRFHAPAVHTMVATDQLAEELGARGFAHLVRWRRGIDVNAFSDGPAEPLALPRPVFLYVGRLAVEKNIDGFLGLDLPGTKLVVGDGPERARLQEQYPAARFLGAVLGPRLGAIYRAADVFVFPSLTDTFGLVMAEALAAGTPVAAFPGAGARTIFAGMECGVLDKDLRKAALAALQISRDVCRAAGQSHSLEESAACFLQIVSSAAGR